MGSDFLPGAASGVQRAERSRAERKSAQVLCAVIYLPAPAAASFNQRDKRPGEAFL